jgi:hypothetical protein
MLVALLLTLVCTAPVPRKSDGARDGAMDKLMKLTPGLQQVKTFIDSKKVETTIDDDIHLFKVNVRGQDQETKLKFLAISMSENGRLGKGSFGTVRLAKVLGSDEIIAFKTLNKIESEEHLARELEITKKVGLLRLPLVALPNGNKGFGMKLITGGTAMKVLQKATTDKAKHEIMRQSLLAIRGFHKLGYIHGDLHDENIMNGGQLIDFGRSFSNNDGRAIENMKEDSQYKEMRNAAKIGKSVVELIKYDYLKFLYFPLGFDSSYTTTLGDGALYSKTKALYNTVRDSVTFHEINSAVEKYLATQIR